jgi:hypothetical protein
MNSSTGKVPFEIVYGYLPRIIPPAVYDDYNPTAMDFVQARMLHHLETQDAIIAAKTQQAMDANKTRLDSKVDPIKVGDWVIREVEYGRKDINAPRKLLTRWIGPYKVISHDLTYTLYTLDLNKEKAHPSFHVSKIKPYEDEPHTPQRRPRISPTIEADNLEIDKVIGHRIKSGELEFLCQWKDYAPEDATYRSGKDITKPEAKVQVSKYIRTCKGQLPVELHQWNASLTPATFPVLSAQNIRPAFWNVRMEEGSRRNRWNWRDGVGRGYGRGGCGRGRGRGQGLGRGPREEQGLELEDGEWRRRYNLDGTLANAVCRIDVDSKERAMKVGLGGRQGGGGCKADFNRDDQRMRCNFC